MLKRTIKTFVARLFAAPAKGPKRLAQSQHGIDPDLVSRHAFKVCEVLQQHGYEAYVVGGAVRDLIAGLEPKDFDVATNATPEQIRPLFRRARIIGKRFKLVHVVFGREIIETSTFRAGDSQKQQTDAHGRILRDNEYGELLDDVNRRDFTLNALYYDPITEEVIDYHNGVEDLKNRVVRMIGDPDTRYREDPVRMLRALRFAAKLNATIEPQTHQPIQKLASLITNVPESRLFDEMLKLLECGHALRCLEQLQQEALVPYLLPFLEHSLADPEQRLFLEIALARTDSRVRSGRNTSPSFVFAALLWKAVQEQWEKRLKAGSPPVQALSEASDIVIEEQSRTLPIQRRYQGDMREIWFMQPRFERVNNRAIWRMIELPRFRAAVDFLQLRAEAKEVDSIMAQWWMDLADSQNTETRAAMIEARPTAPRSTTTRRRRTPRRRPKNTATQDTSSNE
ncbi:polynucleotide adenylyltransferase PcnB [Paenalcaligenes sp. Me131]|uniref:polynucleotide adenylyltransferase PcnB n=1 Tax=Paenalcaligenes sp. Me131 TaxID=3392636 RepID=UPI003D2C4DD3